MKTIKTSILAAFFLAAFTFGASAQKKTKSDFPPKNANTMCKYGGNGNNKMGCCKGAAFLNLSEEQKEKMKAIKIQTIKEIMPIKNRIQEQVAKLKTLATTEVADIQAIEVVIDEITKLKAEMMKIKINKRFEMKKLLDEEQKVMFDAHFCVKRDVMRGCSKGKGQGMRNCGMRNGGIGHGGMGHGMGMKCGGR